MTPKSKSRKNIRALALAALVGLGMASAAQATLVGYWPMTEGTGATLNDATLLGNTGTYNGTIAWSASHTGNTGDYSLSFNQNSATYVSIPLTGALQSIGSGTGAARSFTVSAWVNPTSQSNFPEIWSFGSGNDGSRGLFYQGGNSGNSYAWSDTNGNFQMTTGQTIGNGAWHNVAIVFDGSTTTNNYRYYYDGVLKAQKSIPANQTVALSGHLFLGKGQGSGNGQNWNGLIEDLAVFNSAEDVTTISNATNLGMLHYWTGASANWSNSAAFGLGAGLPGASGTPVVFDQNLQTTTNNDYPDNTQFKGIQFKSGAGTFTLNGNKVNLIGSVVNNSANPQTISLNALVLDTGTGSGTVNAAAGDITISSPVHQGTSANGLTISGAGHTVILSGASDYTGATLVSSGTLRITGSLGNTPVTVNSSATLSGNNASVAAVTGLVTIQSGGNLSPGIASTPGKLTLSNGLTLNASNLNFKLGNPAGVAGTDSDFINVSGGTLTFSGTPTLNVTQLGGFGYGTYDLIDYANISPAASPSMINLPASDGTYAYKLITSNAGHLDLKVYQPAATKTWFGGNNSGEWDINTTSNWNAGTAKYIDLDPDAGSDPVLFDNTAATGNVHLNTIVSPAGVTFSNSTLPYVVSGTGSIAGTTGLTVNGGGTVTLSVANTFSGDTVISNNSTLTLDNTLALNGSTLNYNAGGTLSFGTLTAATLGGLKGSQNLTLQNTSAGAVTLSVGSNGQSTTYGGTLSGSGSLIKAGVGTLALTADSSYTGTTTVNNGILTGTTLSGTTGINVNAGTLNLQSYNAAAPLVVVGGAAANISERVNELNSLH